VEPGLKRGFVAPAGHDQPRGAVVGRLEQLEALETGLAVDRARAGGEAAGKLVPAVGRHGDGIDLHDRHAIHDASGGDVVPPL
jgi:hypothetical protein